MTAQLLTPERPHLIRPKLWRPEHRHGGDIGTMRSRCSRGLTLRDPAFVGALVLPIPAPTFVQTAGNKSSASPCTVAISAAVANNLLVATVALSASGALNGTITTDLPTPAGYTRATSIYQALNCVAAIFYKVAAGGETSYSQTSTGVNANGLCVNVVEFSGRTLWPLDTTPVGTTNAGLVTSLAAPASGGLATGNDVYIASMVTNGNTATPYAWNSGVTLMSGAVFPKSGFGGYLLSPSAAGITATGSWTTASAAACCVATFR